MKEVLPLRDIVKVVAKGCGINLACATTFHATVWEDNISVPTLANLEPGQNTPQSKFYDTKVHWFQSHFLNEEIQAHKINLNCSLPIYGQNCWLRKHLNGMNAVIRLVGSHITQV